MSRSRKKNPYYTDSCRTTYLDKRNSWKSVRNKEDVISGSMYRKVFNSYNIRDWRFYYPEDGYKVYMK